MISCSGAWASEQGFTLINNSVSWHNLKSLCFYLHSF
jgi:hypothetical protein